jgi:hypothetical protein
MTEFGRGIVDEFRPDKGSGILTILDARRRRTSQKLHFHRDSGRLVEADDQTIKFGSMKVTELEGLIDIRPGLEVVFHRMPPVKEGQLERARPWGDAGRYDRLVKRLGIDDGAQPKPTAMPQRPKPKMAVSRKRPSGSRRKSGGSRAK